MLGWTFAEPDISATGEVNDDCVNGIEVWELRSQPGQHG
jgi:hypothetical protein